MSPRKGYTREQMDAWLDAYFSTMHSGKAAEAAGLARATGNAVRKAMMAEAYVQERWADREAAREAKAMLRSDDLLSEWKLLAMSDISSYCEFEYDSKRRHVHTFLRRPDQLPKELWRAVAKLKVTGKGTKNERMEIALWSKEVALTKLSEYQGIRDQVSASRTIDQFHRLTDEEAATQLETDLARLRAHIAAKKAFQGKRR